MTIFTALKEKNILFITHDYFTFTKDQIEALAPFFKNVYVLVRYNRLTDLSGMIPIARLKNHRKKNIINISNLPNNVNVIPTPVLYFTKGKFYENAGKNHLKAVLKAIKKEKIEFDIIHSHFIWTSGYVGSELRKRTHKPLIITGHGYDVYDLPFRNKHWRDVIKNILENSNAIITVSESNFTKLNELNIHTLVKVIPNGYDEKKFYPQNTESCRNKLKLPLDKKLILSVGNLLDIKGHIYLIEAMSHIKKQRDDVICVIVGDGPIKNQLEEKIQQLNLTDTVKLVGKKNHTEIPLWMNACDIYAQPSLKESFGIVIIEAMACGKPVIGTNTGGIPEIIRENLTGTIVEPANSSKLAESILKTLDADWKTDEIIKYAENFSWTKIASKINNVYLNEFK